MRHEFLEFLEFSAEHETVICPTTDHIGRGGLAEEETDFAPGGLPEEETDCVLSEPLGAADGLENPLSSSNICCRSKRDTRFFLGCSWDIVGSF